MKDIAIAHWIDEKTIVTAGLDKALAVWDYSQRVRLAEYRHKDFVSNIRYSAANQLLVFADFSGGLTYWAQFEVPRSKAVGSALLQCEQAPKDDSSKQQRKELEVEQILGTKISENGQVLYNIKWAGLDSSDATWEPL